MKRLLPLLCLLLLLTGCQPKTDTTPVWQAVLPATGVQAALANCTVEEGTAFYRAEDGTEQAAALLRAEGIPILTLCGGESGPLTVEVEFAKPLEEGVYGQDVSTPMYKLDYRLDVQDDGTLQYRFDTVYSFYVTVTTDAGSDALVLLCHREVA